MSQGTAGLAGVLAGRHDPAVGAIHLLSVLEAVPGALKVLTRRRLGELGWDPDSPIGELSDAQVEAVISEFAQPVVRQVVK